MLLNRVGWFGRAFRKPHVWALTSVVVFGACSESIVAPPPPGSGSGPFDALFAPATAAEIQSIRSDWAARAPRSVDAQIELTTSTTFGTMPGRVTVISHLVDGLRHYGAVFVPNGVSPGAPLVAFLHGSEDGVSIPQIDSDFLIGGLGVVRDEAIYAIPSYRSEELRVGGHAFRSEGSESPWDRDVDDALAFVDAALQHVPQVDASRISAIGVSRGALVALLMGVRDSRIQAVTELAGPTDFFGDQWKGLFEEAAEGLPRDLAGIGYLDSRYLQAWLRDEITTAEFRRELVRRSPVLFAADLPSLQVHHGSDDQIVDISQAQSLVSAMQGIGRSPPEFEPFFYSSGHDITGMGGAPDRVRSFLETAWSGPPASFVADLGIRAAGPSSAVVGDTITYTLTTTNDGPELAGGVEVRLALPAGAATVYATRAGARSGGSIVWPAIGTLADGATQVDSLVVVVGSAGALTGTASVSARTTDPDPADNSASVTTSIGGGNTLAALFASPTSSEVQSIVAEWGTRNPRSINPTVVQTLATTASGVPGTVAVISHVVDGFVHYGAVFVPNGIPAGTAPIIVYLRPGDGGVTVPGGDLNGIVSDLQGLSRDFVYAIPSFRSKFLKSGGTTYTSGGTASPLDRDVDDAMAFLDVVRSIVPEADPTRAAAVGRSLGAGVGLLLAIRDPQIDGVIEVSGPTDWYDPWIQGLITDLVAGQPANRAGLDEVNQQFIQPWVRGQLPTADMRLELIRRSPALFASLLPRTQAHHGTADPVVEVSQAQSLIAAMNALGRTPPAFEGFLYQGGTHHHATLTGSVGRMRAFIENLWP